MPEHRTSLRVYRALLRVYPAAFRDRYGEEMVQLLGDQLTDARTRAGGTGVARTWLQVLGDLAVTATSERMWRDRTVANSLAAPLMTTRAFGLAGVVGGLAILAAFVLEQLIFEDMPGLITVRILLFTAGSAAVAVGLRRRQALTSRPGPVASTITWAVVLANMWVAVMELLPVVGWAPFAGDGHLVGFLAGLAMWSADALFGLANLGRGGRVGLAGLALALGSTAALLGMDRFGLTHGDAGASFATLSVAGQGLGGLAWLVLGLDLVWTRTAAMRAPDEAASS